MDITDITESPFQLPKKLREDTQFLHDYEVPLEKWPHELWLMTEFPYCTRCMRGPEDVYFVKPGTGWGEFGMEPCPHGHIVTPERMLMCHEWNRKQNWIWGAIITALTLLVWRSAWIFALIAVIVLWNQHLERVRTNEKYLMAEVIYATRGKYQGLWQPNTFRNQPWLRRVI